MSKTIWYFIGGDIETWPVRIDFGETVAHMKKQIKQENPALNASELTLYRAVVDETTNKQLESRMDELNRLFRDLEGCKKLNDNQQLLGDIFGEVPEGKIYYALVWTAQGGSIDSRASGHPTRAPDPVARLVANIRSFAYGHR